MIILGQNVSVGQQEKNIIIKSHKIVSELPRKNDRLVVNTNSQTQVDCSGIGKGDLEQV